MAAIAVLAVAAATASAQQAQPKAPRAAAPAKQAPAEHAESTSRAGDAQLRQRVDQLEEQITDMQVVIGTLESLARGGAGPAAGPARASSGGGLSATEAGRLDGLETQIRALTAQVEQLAEQVRAMGGRRSGDLDSGMSVAGREVPGRPESGTAFRASPQGLSPRAPDRASGGGFGDVTVTPDPIGRMIGGTPADAAAGPSAPRPGAGQTYAAVAPAEDPGASAGMGSKQLYESAYGHLLQQDYGAAEAAFEDFLQRFPSDPLAGNAQFWLGETQFVRGRFAEAAKAFHKGYQSYPKSAKAPDSLLKLAMSLDRLGQKEVACSSYSELAARFPNAPAHIKSRAQAERQRLGC
jgi:tol-pal system protein YbgF